jgi:hypothetical protein
MRGWQNGNNWVAPYHAIVCAAALVALFLIRVAPPSFPGLSSTAPTVNCNRHHDQRPCFDQGELYAHVAIMIFSPAVTVTFSPLMTGSQPVTSPDASGTHYTRPPPLS